ncbi:Uncharacterised protein [Yersinia rohdei]|uniref:hypothetical protein n=1 Tax=Yersinia rohdei TaxID=29485 RepID=UPI00061C4A94|nr:hypothetical protein [Yersinia rohdei]CNF16523.1 Uncharacterised protein [Yersinia rohdei]
MLSPKAITALMGQANLSGEKSTVVHTILWLVGIIVLALIFLVYKNAPVWLVITFVIFITFILVFYGFVYWHCLTSDPDLLRSEKHVIQKMAIQRQVIGDSDTGVIEKVITPESTTKVLANSHADSSKSGEDK